jgi:hypothetical protein
MRQSPGGRPLLPHPGLDGEAGGPQGDGALLLMVMSPYQGDRYFEYGVLDRA